MHKRFYASSHIRMDDPAILATLVIRAEAGASQTGYVISTQSISGFSTVSNVHSGSISSPGSVWLFVRESRPLTTFITLWRRFCFNVLPFGISSGSEKFQKTINQILLDLEGVECNIDDVLVHGKEQQQHDERLEAVLKRLLEASVTLNLDKCVFSTKQVKFLGHVISSNRVEVDPDKIIAITDLPPPTNLQEVRTFLGMVTQLRKFSDHLADKTRSIRELLLKGNQWKWGNAQQKTFEQIKVDIVRAPVLELYHSNKETKTNSHQESRDSGCGFKEIIHVPRKKTYIADALSRLHAQHTHPQRTIADDEMTAHVASVITGLPALETRLQQIIEAQEEDPVCRQMKIAPKNIFLKGTRVAIPSSMQLEILDKIHEGHQGITLERAKSSVWWPGLSREIQDLVQLCRTCALHEDNKLEPLIETPLLDRPWQIVATDLFQMKGAQLLMGRKLRNSLPTFHIELNPQWPDLEKLHARESERKLKQQTNFNFRHKATPLTPLEPGTEVHVKDLDRPGVVVKAAETPRSHEVSVLAGEKHEVTALQVSPDHQGLAVGGHKSAVSVLKFDDAGGRLVSGSRDTDVIVWDTVNEAGLYRFKGHKGLITECYFMKSQNVLITSSKDSFVKFWDLDTQHCFLTLVGHRSEGTQLSCTLIGTIFRHSHERVVSIKSDSSQTFLGCLGNDSQLELFKTLNDEEIQKHLQKKLKRLRKKARKENNDQAGKVEIYDISSGQLLESVDAHDGPVWGISLSPDKRGFASGSGDSTVKFWEFELVSDAEHSQVSKRLSVTHLQTLKMKEEVLCVKYSPNQRLLAVSLLDCTVKVFFADTLKFFLSLYGHKLPVMALDISSDSNLIITGSADKNIKIWGLDYGDCHKSIFGHDDSIMGLQFVPKTHYFFSVSKDKTLKYWDADKFEHITTLQGHHAEVWCVAVSPDGDYVATGSHDRSLRLWERTDEPLFIEEEREQEREKEYEESLVQNTERVIPGEVDGEAVKAGKKTIETVKAAERLMEAIDLYNEETAKMKEQGGGRDQVSTNPILIAHGNITPARYVLEVVKKIRSSELEESLIVLPFSVATDMLTLLNHWLQSKALEIQSWRKVAISPFNVHVMIHHSQIVANKVLVPVIDSLRQHAKSRVHGLRDTIGFNLAGLRFIQNEMEAREETFFADATEKVKKIRKKQKSSFVQVVK
ncbi:WD repeat-containing protein 3 [Stylophora pistillata]|uniref:WD repeat-containing protein 3 n=1 Tax=Stylophora pistillata TaxID=50429 RepID=A0A2B4SVC6_STYPI|nr:WD repeat-containing protein 3 [Stylophora pistillata]